MGFIRAPPNGKINPLVEELIPKRYPVDEEKKRKETPSAKLTQIYMEQS